MRRAAWTWLWVAVAALAGCTDLVGGGYEYGTLTVQVTFPDSTPYENARVELYDFDRTLSFGYTDADGRHRFRFVPLGALGVRSETPPGYLPALADGVTVPSGEVVEVKLVLTRPCCGMVRVRVVDDAGQPVGGAKLVLYGVTVRAIEAQTGPDGTFVFTGIPSDSYGIQITPPAGYALRPGDTDFVDGITVRPSSDTTVVFPLRRIPAAP